MPRFNWAKLEAPDEFTSFCNKLLVHEVGTVVRTFGKRGPDYQIDAMYDGAYRGQGGKWVFSFKHRQSFAELKRAVTKDIRRIQEITRGDAGAAAAELWEGTTHYVLMTNVKLSPQNGHQLLDTLQGLAFASEVWDGQKLEDLSTRHPFLLHYFFGAERPLFWPVFQYENLLAERPFGKYLKELRLLGRSDVLTTFDGFIADSDQRVLVLTGPGGVGKTRLLLELAKTCAHGSHYEPRFLEPEAQSLDDHLDELDPNRDYLLLLDEAHSYADLRRLLVVISDPNGVAVDAKLVLTCRPAVQAAVLNDVARYFRDEQVSRVQLRKLRDEVFDIAKALGHDEFEARQIARVSEGIPIWAVIVSDRSREGVAIKDLTKTQAVQGLIETYLGELPSEQQPMHRSVLRLLAAVQPLNVGDPELVRALGSFCQVDVAALRGLIGDLRHSGLVHKRGSLLEITPDVIADYLLAEALYTKHGEPTGVHEVLLSALPERIRGQVLGNLARAELVTGEPILDDLLAQKLASIPELDNFQREATLEELSGLAIYRPEEYLRLCQAILDDARGEDESEDEWLGIKFRATRAHADVVAAMPGHLGQVAYRRDFLPDTLRILGRVAVFQSLEDHYGESGVEGFRDVIKYGIRKPIRYQLIAAEMLERWYDEFGEAKGADGRLWLSLVLEGVKELLKLEATGEEWDGPTMHFYRGPVRLTDEVKDVRARALELLRRSLRHADADVRLKAAQVMRRAIRAAVNLREEIALGAARLGTGDKAYLTDQLRELLAICEELAAREDSLAVLAMAESSVDWFSRFGTAEDKAAVNPILAALAARPNYALYSEVMAPRWEPDDRSADEIARDIAAEYSTEECAVLLEEWLREARGDVGRLPQVLFALGDSQPEYANGLLSAIGATPELFDLCARCIDELLAGMRVSLGDGFTEKLSEYGQATDRRRRLAAARALERAARSLDPDEAASTPHIRLLARLLRDEDEDVRAEAVGALARMSALARPRFYAMLKETSVGESAVVAGAIADALLGPPGSELPEAELEEAKAVVWQLVGVRDMQQLGRGDGYALERVLARIAQRDTDWVIELFQKRVDIAEKEKLAGYVPIPRFAERMFDRLEPGAPEHVRALRRVRDLALKGAEYRQPAQQLFKAVSRSEALTPAAASVLQEWLDESPDYEHLVAAATLVVDFTCDPDLVEFIPRVLLAAEGLRIDQRQAIGSELYAAATTGFYGGGEGGRVPVLEERVELFEELKENSPDPVVRDFADRVIADTKADIQRSRDRFEELFGH